MALNEGSLKSRIIKNLESFGFVANAHGRMDELAEAIAKAVVSEITSNAEVAVKGGGSYGGETTKVK